MGSEFAINISYESPRGAIIVGCSHLDAILERLLKSALTRPARYKLFDAYRPLSTLSSKIDMTAALQLIDDPTQKQLHQLRKLRNDLAHSPPAATPQDFTDKQMRLVLALLSTKMGLRAVHELHEAKKRNSAVPESPVHGVLFLITLIATRLEISAISKVKRS